MQPYLQSTSFTCAASSLLTLLHNFNKDIDLNKENEFDIWRKTANLPTRGSCIYAIANYAKKKGLNPKVIVERREYYFPDYRFYRYTKNDVEEAAFMSNMYFMDAQNNEIEIEVKTIELKMVKEALKNNILMIRINTKPIRNEKRNTSNYIIVNGYKNKHFQIIDPTLGALSVPEDVFQEAFETLETKKNRDHRMVLFPR